MTLPKERSFFDYVILASKGFCMGAADVVPGVSGGTMAFILGIYEELLHAIKSFDLQSLRLLLTFKVKAFFESISWKFLLALGFGILTAIFTLARLLAWLLHNTPVLIWSFFLGLILASVVTVSRRIRTWSFRTWVSLTTGLVGIYLLVGLVPGTTPDAPWFLFLSGAVAICAMILPGISGSFILVLMGKYQYILEAVNQRDVLVLFIVAAGACAGIAAFSRLLSWLLVRFHDMMVAFLTGLMLGSLRKIWPWKETVESIMDSHGNSVPIVEANMLPPQLNGEVFAALGLMVAGFLVVFVLDRMVRPPLDRKSAEKKHP
jgi:putative membrane protein